MTYFTPELIALGRSDDDAILDEQSRRWDEAAARYVASLDAVRAQFPPGLRRITENYYLHDAVVHGMGQDRGLFVIVLQLDTTPRSLLTFEYELVDEPTILRDALPPAARTTGSDIDWQYDEIEMVPGKPPSWRQSILFNNGWEVRLHFRDVRVREVQPLIPVPRFAALASGALTSTA